jgi:hypothetical protein
LDENLLEVGRDDHPSFDIFFIESRRDVNSGEGGVVLPDMGDPEFLTLADSETAPQAKHNQSLIAKVFESLMGCTDASVVEKNPYKF